MAPSLILLCKIISDVECGATVAGSYFGRYLIAENRSVITFSISHWTFCWHFGKQLIKLTGQAHRKRPKNGLHFMQVIIMNRNKESKRTNDMGRRQLPASIWREKTCAALIAKWIVRWILSFDWTEREPQHGQHFIWLHVNNQKRKPNFNESFLRPKYKSFFVHVSFTLFVFGRQW